jgi:hypothetical protein
VAGWRPLVRRGAPYLPALDHGGTPWLSLVSPDFLPRIVTASDKAYLVLMGIAVGLVAGIFEELGWTGFAGLSGPYPTPTVACSVTCGNRLVG